MKTQIEIEKMKESILKSIKTCQDNINLHIYGSYKFDYYDREYAKLTAQYNILLEVLK